MSTVAPVQRTGSTLEDLPLYLPRLFYAFLGLVERRLADSGLDQHLRPGMGHVLLALYETDNCIIKEIGQRVQIANGTLTGLLQRMEEAGLVECRKCAADGRAVRVRLTSLGRSLEPKVRRFHGEITATLQKSLSAGEIANAHSLFERMLGTMRADEERARKQKASVTPARSTTRTKSRKIRP